MFRLTWKSMHEPRAQAVSERKAAVHILAVMGILYGYTAESGAVPCVDVRLSLTCALGHKTTVFSDQRFLHDLFNQLDSDRSESFVELSMLVGVDCAYATGKA